MKPRVLRAGRTFALASVAASMLSGCAALDAVMFGHAGPRQSHNSSSLVEFLYPHGATPPAENQIPELRVPLRVGLAFLPTPDGTGPTAMQREELLEQIRHRFADRKFVTEIVTIPDYYLRTNRGFEGLQGVQRLYSVDIVALVSYDQVTNTDENDWSLGYLTIVGAYVLKGNHHDVATLVDLAVVDPVTQSLILRAGGTDSRNRNTTLVDQDREVRESNAAGFASATTQMIDNFDLALAKFEADVRAGKANVRVAKRESGGGRTGGGGSCGPLAIGVLLILLAVRRSRREQLRLA
ncbi:MAG TPA: rhombotarget lipoprotein [Steroidobacteraceae bacterium]|nr:rhombotarget lipoprotein [Steroidobacteraceae bacterium]